MSYDPICKRVVLSNPEEIILEFLYCSVETPLEDCCNKERAIMTVHILGSHKSTNYGTPLPIYRKSDDEFNFDLDPCCNLDNQKAPLGFGPHEHGAPFDGTEKKLSDGRLHVSVDGLTANWDVKGDGSTSVFVNPQYSKNKKIPGDNTNTEMWMKKAREWSQKGLTVVMLVNSNTDTEWFHQYAIKAHELRFVHKRIAFLMDGKPQKSPTKANLIVVFRPGNPPEGFPKCCAWEQPENPDKPAKQPKQLGKVTVQKPVSTVSTESTKPIGSKKCCPTHPDCENWGTITDKCLKAVCPYEIAPLAPVAVRVETLIDSSGGGVI